MEPADPGFTACLSDFGDSCTQSKIAALRLFVPEADEVPSLPDAVAPLVHDLQSALSASLSSPPTFLPLLYAADALCKCHCGDLFQTALSAGMPSLVARGYEVLPPPDRSRLKRTVDSWGVHGLFPTVRDAIQAAIPAVVEEGAPPPSKRPRTDPGGSGWGAG